MSFYLISIVEKKCTANFYKNFKCLKDGIILPNEKYIKYSEKIIDKYLPVYENKESSLANFIFKNKRMSLHAECWEKFFGVKINKWRN